MEQVWKRSCVNSHLCRNHCFGMDCFVFTCMCNCVCVCGDFLSNMSVSLSLAQMIHEDGGSRSKGSPAGKTLKNISLHSSLKLTTRREKEQESDEDSRAQVQTNLNSKSLLTTALTIESRFMSFYDSTMSTFLEQRAIQRALKATSDWKVNWYSLFTCMASSWCFISCQHMFPQL